MIYESRSIRVKIIRDLGLHTNKETSVKPIFKSYKLAQNTLNFVVGNQFFQCFRHKNAGFLFPKNPNKAKRRIAKSQPFSLLLWWFKMPKDLSGLHVKASLSLLFLLNFIYRNAVCKLSQYYL